MQECVHHQSLVGRRCSKSLTSLMTGCRVMTKVSARSVCATTVSRALRSPCESLDVLALNFEMVRWPSACAECLVNYSPL